MESDSKETHYLRDVFSELLERGQAARAESVQARAAGKLEDFAFLSGRVQGYYEALSIMDQQLKAFGIDRVAVGLPDDLNLESELL